MSASLRRRKRPRSPGAPPAREGQEQEQEAPGHVQSAQQEQQEGHGGGSDGGGCPSEAERQQRRRRRMLEEYLAAKRGRPPLKERTNPHQTPRAQPPTPEPAARKKGQRRVTQNRPTHAPFGEADPPARAPGPPKAQRPQGAVATRLPSRTPAKGPPGRTTGRGPSAGLPFGQFGMTGEGEGAVLPGDAHRRLSGHGHHRKNEGGNKENGGGAATVRPGQKRLAVTFGPPSTSRDAAKKGKQAPERVTPRESQAWPGQALAPQTLGKTREPAPRGSAGGRSPPPSRPTAISRPAVKGPNPSGVQRSGASGGLAGRGAPSARGGSSGPPKERSQQQHPNCCLAQPSGRQPRTPKGAPARGRPTLTRALGQSRSAAERRQRSQGAERLPRIPQAKPGPPVSSRHPVPPARGSPKGRKGSQKSRQPSVDAGQAPRTPSTQDRRKLLEAWQASRGKCYKRPPMASSAAKPLKWGKASLNHSFWDPTEEEEGEEKEEQLHVASEITRTLAECRTMAEEGFPPEELLAALSRIPEVEKFAWFWICKAKLQAQQGPLDVAGLYEAAICAGAAPLQELRDAIADILKTAGDPAGAQPAHPSPLQEKEEEEEAGAVPWSLCQEGLPWPQPLSAIKFQILPLSRAKEQSARPEVKLLTPVRRSLRIESAAASYPQMLKDHDPVVSSLEEIMDTDHRSQFIFRNNEALPRGMEVAGFLTGLATPAKMPPTPRLKCC